jgi:predicted nucleic acid-binding protein
VTSVADSGLLIGAVNRDDRHHRWAVQHILAARRTRLPILVPEAVVGEAYTKLRYDRRVSPRRDGRAAMTVFGLVHDSRDAFTVIPAPAGAHLGARALLAKYSDQSFSYVDALVFLTVDAREDVSEVLTVDGSDFRTFAFSRPVAVVTPAG